MEMNKIFILHSKKSESYIPKLSLVARRDQEIIGHVMLTKAKIGQDIVLALAPLSVKPKYQKQGIGSALINQAHEIARQLGYSHIVILGEPAYYQKFGYRLIDDNIISSLPREYIMIYQLDENAQMPKGQLSYAREFGV